MTRASHSSWTAFGECRDCCRPHGLAAGRAETHAREMMRELRKIERLDYRVSDEEADPLLSFDNVFGRGRGNMFGVLECRDTDGETVVLRAFSSLPWGLRDIEGWVSPLLPQAVFDRVIVPARREIERLTRDIGRPETDGEGRRELEERRRRRSQSLLREMQDHYRLRNFRGETRPLRDVYALPGGVPGGVGECCAPKLLQHAATHGLTPIGLAEFHWGGDKGAAGRESGRFYPCCEARCRPILGFMLCGLDELDLAVH